MRCGWMGMRKLYFPYLSALPRIRRMNTLPTSTRPANPAASSGEHPPATPSGPRPNRQATLWRWLCVCWALAALALSQGVSAAPAGGAATAAFGPLISPRALVAQLGQVRVVDIRENDDSPSSYAGGHIPGGVSAPYPAWRGPADNPGKLLPLSRYTALVRSLGIDAQTPVVLVAAGSDPSDFGAPARVYWTLKWLGLKHLAILNGGMAAWHAAGLPLSTRPVKAKPTHFAPQMNDAVIATRTDVEHDLQVPHTTLLLDARPRAFYLGRVKAPAALRPGTLPGALDFDNARWFPEGGGALPAAAVLAGIAQGLPQQPGTAQTVSFCNTGHWAATNWFVLSEVLRRPDVRLYPGSMVDWSRADAPMANVPSRLKQLWTQLEQTWQAL